jgi:hypothetical protein
VWALLQVVFLEVVSGENRPANQMGHFSGTTFVVVGLSVSPLIIAMFVDAVARWKDAAPAKSSDEQHPKS